MCGDIVVTEDDDEASAGDTAAEPSAPRLDYEQFFREYRPQLLRHARRIADSPEQGEDALQEAMVEAHQKWAKVSITDWPVGWMIRVIQRKLFHLRKGQQQPREVLLTVDLEAVADFSEALAKNAELWDAVRQLPPRQREFVSLRYSFDLDTSEIAAHLGIKESTVRSNLARAYARLRVLLTSERGDNTP